MYNFMFFFGIFLCFVPLIAIMLIWAFKFKETPAHMFIAVLVGLAAVIPTSFIQYFLPGLASTYLPLLTGLKNSQPVLYSFLRSIFLYGLVEELLKMLLIKPMPHKNYEVFDFLMLAFIFGAALGCFESVVYYVQHLLVANMRGAEPLYGIIIIRIFSSMIVHTACAGLCGLYVFTTRNKPSKFSFLFSAILLHGIYDFFAGFQNGLRWFAIPVILLAIAECRIKYTSLQKDDN